MAQQPNQILHVHIIGKFTFVKYYISKLRLVMRTSVEVVFNVDKIVFGVAFLCLQPGKTCLKLGIIPQ